MLFFYISMIYLAEQPENKEVVEPEKDKEK